MCMCSIIVQVRFCRPMTRWYCALRERRWQTFPKNLTSVFRFMSADHKLLIDSISEDECV